MEPKKVDVALGAGGAVTALVYEAGLPRVPGGAALILAHGAGAGQLSSFMVGFARAFAAFGVDTVTFNFPYTQQGRRVPDRGPVLESCCRAVVDTVSRTVANGRPLFVGGKSMGGRIATQVAAADPNLSLAGLVLLGYPLHPPGRPGERRDRHLPNIRRPMLFVQGSRDAFGTPEELGPIVSSLSPPATLHVVPGGDHSFKISRSADQASVYADVQRTIVEWMARISAATT